MMKLSHRDRIQGLLAGNEIDHTPIAFWRHFPADDQIPTRLADAAINFQRTFDFDLIKVSPSSSFCIRDWGIKDIWSGNTEGTRDYIQTLSIAQLENICVLESKTGSLGKQLKALNLIIDQYKNSTPVIQTIFSPLSQLKNIVGKSNLISVIRQNPTIIKKALEVITKTTLRFMQACQESGVDGFFFAVQHASADVMSLDEFSIFGKQYDEMLFEIIGNSEVNILHIHGTNIYFDTMLDYPCQILNWHDRDTTPSLVIAAEKTKKIFCGGLSRIRTMVSGTESDIQFEIEDAIRQTGEQNLIIGTGCVLPIITPFGNIKHAVHHTRLL